MSRVVVNRSEKEPFDLASSAVESRLERLDRDAERGRRFARGFAEDVAPEEGLAQRGIYLGKDDGEALTELAVDELLFG
jgi:hypothetical protein